MGRIDHSITTPYKIGQIFFIETQFVNTCSSYLGTDAQKTGLIFETRGGGGGVRRGCTKPLFFQLINDHRSLSEKVLQKLIFETRFSQYLIILYALKCKS